MTTAVKDRPWLNEVAELIDGAILEGAEELCCVDVEWLKGPETLRVFIDKRPEQGQDEPSEHITVDECAKVNRILFECPELDQKINSPYNLEVSSLGLEPPLRLPRHFRCYLGETVKVKLSEPIAREEAVDAAMVNNVKGELLEVTDEAISVQARGFERPVTIRLSNIIKAKAVYAYADEQA